MSVLQWSPAANSNGNVDPDINWLEGQAPSTINDSGRAMMAAIAKWRDDNNGALQALKGTGNAYAVGTNQGIADLTKVFTISFTASAANSGAATLAVDLTAAKPMRGTSGVDLATGEIVTGVVYQAVYSVATGEYLIAALARGATDARYLSKALGGTLAGDLAIANASPGLNLIPQGGGFTWRVHGSVNGNFYVYRPNEGVFPFILGPDGSIATTQLGDLNTRIETRGAAYGEAARASAIGTAYGYATNGDLTGVNGANANANSRVSRSGDSMSGALAVTNYLDIVRGGVLRARWVVDGSANVILQNGDNGDNFFYVNSAGAVWTKLFGDLNSWIESRASAYASSAQAGAQGYTDYYRNGNSPAVSPVVGSSIVARDAYGRSAFNSGSADASGYPMVENSYGRMGALSIANGYLGVPIDGSPYGINFFASDRRLKENIADSSYDALGKLRQFRWREFDYRRTGLYDPQTGHRAFGVISQEIEEIDPAFVNDMGALKHPNSERLTFLGLMATDQLSDLVMAQGLALQRLTARVASLEARAA